MENQSTNGFWDDWQKTREKKVRLPVASERLGRDVEFTIRMPQAGDILAGMPEAALGTESFDTMPPDRKEAVALAWERWGNLLIARSVIDPPTTPEQAATLTGQDRLALTHAIMEFAAWRRGDQASPFPATGAPDGRSAESPAAHPADRPAA